MNRRYALLLIFLGIASASIAAWGVASPGYMDADYYYSMGIQWSAGLGAEEPFLWNYLSGPESIPTPSHAYWSPFISLLSGLTLRVIGDGFRSAQLPFIISTALLPILVWRLAISMEVDDRTALLAGLLALAPGFFLPFFITTDAFSFYALLGVILMLLLQRKSIGTTPGMWVGVGVLSGLAHLSRADGFVFIVIPLGVVLSQSVDRYRKIGFIFLGYLIVMAPWFYRNQIIFGSPLASGGGRTLWLLSYDEIFSYPAQGLTLQRWWGSGLDQIFLHRWSAIRVIAQRIVAENGLIFLFPFMLIGIVVKWHQALVRSTVVYLAVLFILMALIFPFAGARGGWFHSSAAVMPALWVMAPIGLKVGVEWVGRRREWDLERAYKVFSATMVGFALILTWGLFAYRVTGVGQDKGIWNEPTARYKDVYEVILERDPSPGVLAINNPPGLYHETGLSAVVIPVGDVGVLKQVVDKYGVSWIILDPNHPEELGNLFHQIDVPSWLTFETSIITYGDTYVFYRVIEA